MEKSKIAQNVEQIAETVTAGYKAVETAVVDSYKKVESTFVEGYQRIEDHFVEKYLVKEGESLVDAKARLKAEEK